MNETAAIATLIGAISGLLTILTNWFFQKHKLRHEASKTDRELLSADERSFRQTIIEELERVRRVHTDCETRTIQLTRQNLEQQAQINVMRARILELEILMADAGINFPADDKIPDHNHPKPLPKPKPHGK